MRPNPARKRSCESGQIAGIEVLPFGFLILVVATLMITSAWTVIDSKLGVTAAAREGARSFVEAQNDLGAATEAADTRARETLVAYGRAAGAEVLVAVGDDAIGSRCGQVSVTVRRGAPMLSLPWLGGLGGTIETTATHSELLDPYRSDSTCAQ